MLGNTEGKRRTGPQRVRGLDGILDSLHFITIIFLFGHNAQLVGF